MLLLEYELLASQLGTASSPPHTVWENKAALHILHFVDLYHILALVWGGGI